MTVVNLNRTVRVKLTYAGMMQLDKFERDLNIARKYSRFASLEAGNTLECQLWELMSMFGGAMGNGNDALFVHNDIELLP